MAATPNLDRLNVLLARRLGDPADTDGTEITVAYLGDGVAYTNRFREQCLTESLRLYLNMFGHDKVQDAGFPLNYMEEQPEKVQLTDGEGEVTLDPKVARVIYVDYYGHKALPATFELLKRRHHSYWQKTAMYRVDYAASTNLMRLRLYVSGYQQSLERDIIIYYIRTIPDLTTGGSEDIELDPYHDPTLLALAEAIARRNHQEQAPYLARSADESLNKMKENL